MAYVTRLDTGTPRHGDITNQGRGKPGRIGPGGGLVRGRCRAQDDDTALCRIDGGKRPANIRGRIDLPGNAAREVRVDQPVAQPADDDAARADEPDPRILGREEAGRNAPLPTGQQHWSLSYKASAHQYKTRVLWM